MKKMKFSHHFIKIFKKASATKYARPSLVGVAVIFIVGLWYNRPSVNPCLLFSPGSDASIAEINENISPSPTLFPIFEAWLKSEDARYGPALRDIPPVLLNDYTLQGKVKMTKLYFDQSYLGSEAFVSNWTFELVDDYRRRVRAREARFNYDNGPLYDFFEKKSKIIIAGKRGLVIGSEIPWLEAMLLEFGATSVDTVEFGEITSHHPQIRTHTPRKFTAAFFSGTIAQFDFAFSYSSLEHDGLGRYGDVLNPHGDLQTMAKLLSVVKPGGFVLIGVPCCHDKLDWNAHRIYGPLRLPLLFAGYRVLSVHPSDMRLGDDSNGYSFQPVWVLQNMWGCSNTGSLSQLLKNLNL